MSPTLSALFDHFPFVSEAKTSFFEFSAKNYPGIGGPTFFLKHPFGFAPPPIGFSNAYDMICFGL